MEQKTKCPRCGADLPSNTADAQCPKCMLEIGMGTQTVPPSATTRTPPPAPAELAGHFPQLEIVELLGQGGMGVVYKARQLRLDRFVALKILPADPARDPAFAERFAREARALARLNHPNIVAVHDFGEAGGIFYLLMEFVDGANLRHVQRFGGLTPREALGVVPTICDALQYAHEQGIVHRDIKPENILIDKTGRVKIADFGLAKMLGRTGADPHLTRTEQVMGTATYMAPEQLERPLEVDHRADIYSLGVVLYEMLTGELPVGKFAPPSQKVQVDVRLDEIVLRALEKERERRYQAAREFKTDLETVSQTSDPPKDSTASAPLHTRASAGAKPSTGEGRRRSVFSTATVILAVLAAVVMLAITIAAAGFVLYAILRAPAPVSHATSDSRVLANFTTADPTIANDLTVTNGAWIATVKNDRTVRLFEVSPENITPGTLLYNAQLQAEGLEGRAYLEMWCRFPGKGEFFSRGFHTAVNGTTDWVTSQTPFFLQPGETPDLVRLNVVVEGAGKVWIRNVTLSHSPAP